MTNYREKLTHLWEFRISDIYETGQIATERALQSVLFRELDGNGKDPLCWIEPTMWVQTSDQPHPTIKPDIVITEDYEIKCIIELKYFPNKQVRLGHDLKKLKELFGNPKMNGYLLRINPMTGVYNKDKRYKIVPDTLFVMACIASKEWWEVNQPDEAEIITESKINNFLLLKASIKRNDFDFQM